MIIKKKRLFYYFSIIGWTIGVGSYFLQFPFRRLSSFIVVGLFIFLLFSFISQERIVTSAEWLKAYSVYFGYLIIMFIVALLDETSIQQSVRFLLILFTIPLFTILQKDEFKIEYHIFIIFALIKSVILIYFAYILISTGSYDQLRVWAKANDFGDIYIVSNTRIPRVQVHGNGILPMAFMINSKCKKGRLNHLFDIILLLGVISAGNMAFLLAIGIYYIAVFFMYMKDRNKLGTFRLVALIMLMISVVVFSIFTFNTMRVKAGWSNAIRLDQARALLDNYFLVGNGLGNKIVYSGIRTYSGNTYFELQTLYIFNQIGLIGLSLFYYLVLSRIRQSGSDSIFLFLIYLIYSFWNPYCFDTTEMITISLLIHNRLYKT